MAAALDTLPPAPSIHKMNQHARDVGPAGSHSCPECGAPVELKTAAEEAHKKIQELEAQVELLKEKATSAVDKCADYEDQLRTLQASHPGIPRSNTTDSLTTSRASNEDGRPSTANSAAAAKQSRFSFLTGRRGSPSPAPAVPATPDTELLEQLEKERRLRAKAEERAQKVDAEIEELSVQLFSQANEMVAEERKARAKLEARVEQLEKKDKDKMARLERLEKAVSRIDRVKALLAAPTPSPQRRP